MEIKDIVSEQAIYIVVDLEHQTSFLEKNDINEWISDGSIQPGFMVLQATIHNVFKAKSTVELVNASNT